MKNLNIKVDCTFEVTNEIQTYGRDGSKHRVGSFEGNGIVFLEFMGRKTFLYSFEKQKRRNQFSGRLDTFLSYFGRKEVEETLTNFFTTVAKEENLKTGIKFGLFLTELAHKLKNENNQLPYKQVFSHKEVTYSIVLP